MLAPLLVGELRPDAGLGLLGLEPAVALDPLDHALARGGYEPDFVEQRLPVGLDQDRRLDNDRPLLAAAAHRRDHLAHAREHLRMHDRVEPFQRRGIGKYDRPELAAVNRAVGSEDALTESVDQFPVGGSARLIDLVADFIGVDCGRAELGQNFRRCALARSDSARESDSDWFHC